MVTMMADVQTRLLSKQIEKELKGRATILATLTSAGETQRLLSEAADDIQVAGGNTNEMQMQRLVKPGAEGAPEAEEV